MEREALEARDFFARTLAGGGSLDATATNAASLMSIAISLKRIADAVSGVPYDSTPGADNSKYRLDITSGIMHAIEQGLLAASQRG